MENTNDIYIGRIDSNDFFEFLKKKLWTTKRNLIQDISKNEQTTDDLWTTVIDETLDLDKDREKVDLRHEREEALMDLKRLRALIDFFEQEHVILGYGKEKMSFLEVKSNFKFIEHEVRRCPEDLDDDTIYGEYTIRFKIDQRT